MPFTGNCEFKANPRLVVRDEGCYYWDHKGGKIIDASSSLFCCSASHSRPEIAEAVYQQLQEVVYTPHFQMEHPSSFKLAQQISAMTPDEINHVFFNNSGSESVDTALIPYKGNRDWLEDILPQPAMHSHQVVSFQLPVINARERRSDAIHISDNNVNRSGLVHIGAEKVAG